MQGDIILLMSMIKQYQITKSDKFAIALQYLKKEVSHDKESVTRVIKHFSTTTGFVLQNALQAF